MNKRNWLLAIIGIGLLIGVGWNALLFGVPTDRLVGNGDFSRDQFQLRYFALSDSQWTTDGINVYRAILRVDTRDVNEWLDLLFVPDRPGSAENWQTGEHHQYLVDRRDGDGKRVIPVTLRRLALTDLSVPTVMVALVTLLAVGAIVYRHAEQPYAVPLTLLGGGTLLSLAWQTIGLPFCYLAIGWPFIGQLVLHIAANTLTLGAILHLALTYTSAPRWMIQHRREILLVVYGIYPLGLLIILITQSGLTNGLYWEHQAAIGLKAVSYLVWTVQYRRANVTQRGQMHWLLAGLTAFDLVYVVQVVSDNEALLPLVQWAGLLPPLGLALALLPGRSLRIALEPAYSVVQGIANTLTLALFLCGLGLAATLLVGNREALSAVTIILAVLLSLTTVPLATLLREQFDSWFGGTRGAQRALLHHFTQRVSNQIALDGILHAFREALDQSVQPVSMGLWLRDDESGVLRGIQIPTNAPALVQLREGRLSELQTVTTERGLLSLFEDGASELWQVMIALTTQGELVGLCAIGARVDGRNYLPETLRFFETLTRSATLAFRNAQLVQRLEDNIFALRQAYQQLVTVQEDERKHLAAELHDETLQQLAHLNLLTNDLRPHLEGEQQTAAKALQGHILTIECSLREILRGLHPAVLTDLGLIPALQSWLPRHDDILVTLDAAGFGVERLPDLDLELTLYRLVQEAVNNALKHAHARRIDLRLQRNGNMITLHIVDDGIGFVPALVFNVQRRERIAHFGLLNMHERVRALSGTISIQSEPERGTTITIQLPLHMENLSND